MSQLLPETELDISKDGGWTNVMFDSQILGTFMECNREMDLRHNKHLVSVAGPSPSMLKGTLAHEGLRAYYEAYKAGHDFTSRVALALQAARKKAPTLVQLNAEDCLLVYRTLEDYFQHYMGEVIHVAFTEKVFTHVAYEVFPLRIILTGRIDLGTIEGDQLIPNDHKTEAETWFYSSLANQFKFYALACNSSRLYVRRVGFQQSKKPSEKYKVETLTFDKDVMDEYVNITLPYYAKQMLICDEENYYPPNYASCIKGHFGCIFSDKYRGGVCSVDRSIREEKLNLYFKQEEWDPAHDEN